MLVPKSTKSRSSSRRVLNARSILCSLFLPSRCVPTAPLGGCSGAHCAMFNPNPIARTLAVRIQSNIRFIPKLFTGDASELVLFESLIGIH